MDAVVIIIVVATALVVTVIGGAMLAILGAWYGTMFRMFGTWLKELLAATHRDKPLNGAIPKSH